MPLSPMTPHRALAIPDVLHEVFKHFATHPWLTTPGAELVSSELSPTGKRISDDDFQAIVEWKRRTLAHAARTCKVFAEPASRVLWEVQEGLGPIASVLKDARVPDSEDNGPDWVRFEHVARRVRVLYAAKGSSCDEDMLALLRSRYDGRPIFPNLRALFCGMRPLDVTLLEGLCASPALVLVDTREGDGALVKTLMAVSDACPEIGHLHAIKLTSLDEDSHRALAKFNDLHTVRVGCINNELFRHLGGLPNLRMLYGAFAISNPDMGGTKAAFPALQELFIEDERDDTDFLVALPFISSRSLTLVTIRLHVELTEDMLEYLDELCASPALARLRELDLAINISFNQWDNEDEPFEGVAFADVVPLLRRLRELTVLAIVVEFTTSTVAGFGVEDTDLRAIAAAWPGLVRLEIGHSIDHDDWPGGPEGISRPSLGAVVALAECCRELVALNVEFGSVDARALEKLVARAAACAAPQTELRQFVEGPGVTDFCQKLRLTDPARVAAALRKLFPNVVSGLEMVTGGVEEGAKAVRYRGWYEGDMNTDMFRLMKALEHSHLDA